MIPPVTIDIRCYHCAGRRLKVWGHPGDGSEYFELRCVRPECEKLTGIRVADDLNDNGWSVNIFAIPSN